MINAYLNAKITRTVADDNPFYGRMKQIYTINETYQMEFDNRDDICPFGIIAEIETKEEYIELNISRNYFTSDDEGWYHAAFSKDNLVFRIDLLFNEDNDIDLDSSTFKVYYADEYIEGDDVFIEQIYAKDFKKLKKVN